MNMAKASTTDLDLAQNIARIIEDLEKGFMPNADDSEDIVWFDIDSHDDCKHVINAILNEASRGSLFRVTFGMLVLCDPANTLLNPDSDILEPHPLIVEMENDLARETQAARYWNMRYHQVNEQLEAAQLTAPFNPDWCMKKAHRDSMLEAGVVIQNLEASIRTLTEEAELYRGKLQREQLNTNRWKNRAELAEAQLNILQSPTPIYQVRDEFNTAWIDTNKQHYELRQRQKLDARVVCIAPDSVKPIKVTFMAACNGLWYENPMSCGEVSKVRVGNTTYSLPVQQSPSVAVPEAGYEICSLWRHGSDNFCIQFGDKSGLHISEIFSLTNEGAAAVASAIKFYGLLEDSSKSEPSELVKESSAPYPHPRISEQDVLDIAQHAIAFINGTMKDALYYAEKFIKEKRTNELLTKLNCTHKFVDLRQIVSDGSES